MGLPTKNTDHHVTTGYFNDSRRRVSKGKPHIGSEQSFFRPQHIRVQPKLTVNAPYDIYEKEADTVADRVMRMPDPQIQRQEEEEESLQRQPVEDGNERIMTRLQPQAEVVQRKCTECEHEEEGFQRKPLAGSITPLIQRKHAGESAVNEQVSASLKTGKGRGRHLPENTRNWMENRFGADFGDVKVHTDSQALQLSRELGAQAFTHGNDIYFNQGKFAPDTSDGKGLLAHELVHVVQQSRRIPSIQRRIFGENLQFEALPGMPMRARVFGPYSNEAIAEILYGNVEIGVRFDPNDSSVVLVDRHNLLDRWRTYFPSVETIQGLNDFGLTDEQLANVGLFALGNVLRTNAADSVGVLRTLYNNGISEIITTRNNIIHSALPQETAQRVIRNLGNNLDRSTMVRLLERELSSTQAERIARTVSTMRHDLAINVRRTGGMLLEKGAELIDAVRGQARPTYDSLRAAGKSNAEIILSATRSNRFVNRLPSGMRISGGIFLVGSAGFSVYIVLSADPADRGRLIREEAGGVAGGLIGGKLATLVCVGAGIATGGFGLIVCGLVGATAGAIIGRDPYGFLQLLDIAPHHSTNIEGKMYRLQGTLEEIDLLITSIPRLTVHESRRALVIATGMISGSLVGGRGHYRRYQVIPANSPAEEILEGREPKFIPNYALRPYSFVDLQQD